MKPANNHYVYMYRDGRKILYVGYGKSHSRATWHQTGSHNAGVDALVASGKYFIEIAGPFDSEKTARAVEAALISALAPELNIAKAPSASRFRPMGVPHQFAARLHRPALKREDFLGTSNGKPIAPVMFVRINELTHEGWRKGYDPVTPPTDPEILVRMDRYWQVGSFVDRWISHPQNCPRTLVAVYGGPGSQIIIGAVTIDPTGWNRVESAGARWEIPTRPTKNLDAHRLRGRRIAKEARLSFGPNNNQIFIILNPDGTVIGGSPLTRA